MSRTVHRALASSDRYLCRGILSAARQKRLPACAQEHLRCAKEDFLHCGDMARFGAAARKNIMHAIELTLEDDLSFYSVQRRYALPIDEAGKFGALRCVYCDCLLHRFSLSVNETAKGPSQ